VAKPKIQLEEDQPEDRQDEKNNTRHHQKKCSAGSDLVGTITYNYSIEV